MATDEDTQEKSGDSGGGGGKGSTDATGAGKSGDFRALLISGTLAIVTTAAAQGVKAYLDGRLATARFHSSLIEKALQSANVRDRVDALRFLTDVNLITDNSLRDGLDCYLRAHPNAVPQFLPADTTGAASHAVVASYKSEMLAAHPELSGKELAVVGFTVESGDIVNGLSPIYAELIDDPAAHHLTVSSRRINTAMADVSLSDEESMVKNARIVTEVDLYVGDYYGQPSVAKMVVTWRKLTRSGYDIDMSSDPFIATFGKDARVDSDQGFKQLRAPAGCYIDDIRHVGNISHTTGDAFMDPQFEVTYRSLPHGTDARASTAARTAPSNCGATAIPQLISEAHPSGHRQDQPQPPAASAGEPNAGDVKLDSRCVRSSSTARLDSPPER